MGNHKGCPYHLMGILLDAVCQWLILGASYPGHGAVLVVGPVLIVGSYTFACALANRFVCLRKHV